MLQVLMLFLCMRVYAVESDVSLIVASVYINLRCVHKRWLVAVSVIDRKFVVRHFANLFLRRWIAYIDR